MKKLLIIAIVFISMQGIAQQEKKERSNNKEMSHKMNDITPEEAANLRTKKMTLHLDLNESQQAEIYKLNLENASMRKSKMAARKAKKEGGSMEKPTTEERLAMQNAKLDHLIAMKAKMKTILNNDQYVKWESSLEKRGHKKHGMKKGRIKEDKEDKD